MGLAWYPYLWPWIHTRDGYRYESRARTLRVYPCPALVKCQFKKEMVKYLGTIISTGQIAVSPAKAQSISDWPIPTKVQDIQSFLGAMNFWREFIPGFSSIACPLHNLTHKDTKFKWTLECQTAFDTLKSKISSEPILKHPMSLISSSPVLSVNRRKSSLPAQLAPFKLFPPPSEAWEGISADLIVDLPNSNRYDTVSVVVNRFTKRAHFILTFTSLTASGAARLFRDHVWTQHGWPKKIISDRGQQFAVKFTLEHNKLLGIQTALSTAYHLQTDGQTEQIRNWNNTSESTVTSCKTMGGICLQQPSSFFNQTLSVLSRIRPTSPHPPYYG